MSFEKHIQLCDSQSKSRTVAPPPKSFMPLVAPLVSTPLLAITDLFYIPTGLHHIECHGSGIKFYITF